MKKVIVITGATSGIGRALAESFADNDYIVYAGYRNPDYERDLKKISSNVIPFFIDMEKSSIIDGAAVYIKREVKHVDILINAAGCVMAGAMENMSLDKLKKQFDVNTFSHLRFTQKLADLLNGSKVINISSMASFGIFPFVAPYCASKRALDILFNSLEIETNHKFKVVSVKPGVIATPLWEKSVAINQDCIKNDKAYEKEMKFMAKNAMKNSVHGLPVSKVVNLITDIANLDNPKSSYTVGLDAVFAELVSRLPQDWINFIVELGLKKKGLR
ncbi:SDR family NAD(P)-dependent oxidoreductase [bacterium]|nr:SDR family NAD(P)-dependent oxidoreductase [bacterium]MBR6302035.1 SDR family NAD(P)-dependent oxidoreductase [bacterium]